jgi:pyruvate/2-oxoglutarate dehydrogenase complex dihydrolipoamide acyltransferase (E2) component
MMPPPGIAAMAGMPPLGATVADGAGSAGEKADETYLPLTPMRKAIAAHMVHSKQTAPHATTTIEVDMTRLVKWRERHKEAMIARHGVDITYVAMVMVALVDALKAFPIMNSSWGEDRIILKKRVNIGVAVALDDGLLVPVIHNADERNMVGLARAVADLATRARAGRLTLNDLQGGTFTLNNTGVFGAIVTTPVINQPEAAILAMNAIVKRPVVIEDDAIAVRSMMILSLSFDHRIVDGFTAGRFMQHIVKNINGLELPSV